MSHTPVRAWEARAALAGLGAVLVISTPTLAVFRKKGPHEEHREADFLLCGRVRLGEPLRSRSGWKPYLSALRYFG